MPAATVVIKQVRQPQVVRYRRSRYVNLDDIATRSAKASRSRSVDAKTGQDLTRVTLTQIITEDAKDKPTGLPLELLGQLVVASDEVRQEFVMWYLKSAFRHLSEGAGRGTEPAWAKYSPPFCRRWT